MSLASLYSPLFFCCQTCSILSSKNPRVVCCLVLMREACSAQQNTTVATASIFGKPQESESLTCSSGCQLKSPLPPRPPPMLQSPPLETSPLLSSISLPLFSLSPTSNSQVSTLQELASTFATVTNALPKPAPAKRPTVSPGFPTLPRVATAPAAAPPLIASTQQVSPHFRVCLQP